MARTAALSSSAGAQSASDKRVSKTSDSIFAGAFAGMVARLISAPLDLLKIRFQLQGTEALGGSGPAKYRNVWQATKTIVKEEGLTALWKGNIAATYLWVSYSMVQFGIYGMLKEIGESFEAKMLLQQNDYRQHNDPFGDISNTAGGARAGNRGGKAPQVTGSSSSNQYLHALMLFLCGAGAAIVATSATYPFDIMRTQFTIQGNTKVYPTILSFVSGTLQKQGPKGFYAGLTPTLVGITPYIGLNFAFYDLAKKWTEDKSRGLPTGSARQSQLASVLKNGFSGAIAGGASKLIVYPLDTVKRRMQASVLQSTLGGDGVGTTLKYRGMMDCLRQTVHGEGISGLYKGVGPTLLKSCVSTAITFVAYEHGLQIAKSLRSVEDDAE